MERAPQPKQRARPGVERKWESRSWLQCKVGGAEQATGEGQKQWGTRITVLSAHAIAPGKPLQLFEDIEGWGS